jgi:hypothetical protein
MNKPNTAIIAEQSEPERLLAASPPESHYPPELLKEYHALTDKKLLSSLTFEEEARLATIETELAERDRTDPAFLTWKTQCEEMQAKLDQIRREAETLLGMKK